MGHQERREITMDAAFKTAAYPTMTTKELEAAVERAYLDLDLVKAEKLSTEIERRKKAMAGDESVMTQGERLRFIRTGKAR